MLTPLEKYNLFNTNYLDKSLYDWYVFFQRSHYIQNKLDMGDDISVYKNYVLSPELDKMESDLWIMYPAEYDRCRRLYNSHRKQVARLKKVIRTYILTYPCLFLTLTFNDDYLNKTSPATRRRYIVDFLNQYKVPYVANIDFGGKFGREHYHAVICIDQVDFKSYKYGLINGEKIHVGSSETKISKYITKLSSHAVKDSTKNHKPIYSKIKTAYYVERNGQIGLKL